MRSNNWKSIASGLLLSCAIGATVQLPSVVFAQTQVEQEDLSRQLAALKWYESGRSGSIAGVATFQATDRYTFLSSSDTDKFLVINGNPSTSETKYTVAPVQGDWFAILNFEPEGLIKDDEKIDADLLLKSLKEANVAGSEKRRELGLSPLTLLGWAIPPRYDNLNKRLEWATLIRDEQSQLIFSNVSTKILGRSGYTNVTLVTDSADSVERDLAEFKASMVNFKYVDGEKYSDWKEGDKVAAYGLGALVLGGAAAVATSKGGFKLVGLAIFAALAAMWAAIKRFFGNKKTDQ
jgi:uncharacterized membrane-anchored protein